MTPLRQKLIRDLTIRGRAEIKIKSYVKAVEAFAKHYRRSPRFLCQEEVQDYLYYLHHDRKLAPRSCGVAAHALRFLYHVTLKRTIHDIDIPAPKTDRKLPEILSPEEVVRLIEAASNLKHKALLMATYGEGLRVSEVTHLKLTDIDSDRMLIWVRAGKGNKDRCIGLSERLLAALRSYWCAYQPQDWLFPSPRNHERPVSRQGARWALKAALRNARIKKKITVHGLINRCAHKTYLTFRTDGDPLPKT